MTYSEDVKYTELNLWDIFTRDSKGANWEWLRVSTKDETAFVEKMNAQRGFQYYSISRRTRSV